MDEITAHAIHDEASLRGHFGATSPLAVAKAHTRLDRNDRAFIARTPFLTIGTQGADGRADVSPRGDPPGFVKVLDDATIAIPDRPGNNRLDTMTNILANPAVGLLFMVPGFDDTLRINGRARLTTAPSLLATMAMRGRTPTLAIVVAIDEIFLHCAKAFRRSKLWDPASRQDRSELPSLTAIIMEQTEGQKPDEARIAEADERLEAAYVERLY
ncbi:pyridoxamine 5'-phosphate oxidase family protein [Acuticoccus mangrovi]|uniref:pyridoxamine 5'-phosphate oxidase family protein n=1 Tax=Acuticoccus mangrovi TaxID=2796142 RepID=UPI002FCB2F19